MRIEGTNSTYIDRNMPSQNFEFPLGKPKDHRPKEFVFGEKEFIDAIHSTNKKLEVYNSRLEFTIHEKTNDIIVRVIDITTNETIREIPPRKLVDMVANMLERAGLLVDERA